MSPCAALALWAGILASQSCSRNANSASAHVIRRLATTLNVTADLMAFDTEECRPDDDLRLAFEATRNLDADARRTVSTLLDAILLEHDARRWTNASCAPERSVPPSRS